MTKTGKTKTSKTKMSYKELKALAEELAGHVVFALKFLDTKGKGKGLRFNLKTQTATVWQEDFMNSLDKCGFVIDRKAYWKSREDETPDDGRGFPRGTGELIVVPGHHNAPCGWPCIAGGVSIDHARTGKPVHGKHSWGNELVSCACGGSR